MEARLVALDEERLLLPAIVARRASRVGAAGRQLRLVLVAQQSLVLLFQTVAELALTLTTDAYTAMAAGAGLGAAWASARHAGQLLHAQRFDKGLAAHPSGQILSLLRRIFSMSSPRWLRTQEPHQRWPSVCLGQVTMSARFCRQ